MKLKQLILSVACLAVVPASVNAVEFDSGSDSAFDQLVGTMANRDTGSGWFDYYVEVLNQEIAVFQSTEDYGAAGPSGPLNGFEGYISGFRFPDSGSAMFNRYVDAVNRVIQEKQQQ